MSEDELVRSTRDSYNLIARQLADMWRGELADRPLDRALLATFAELAGERGQVLDAGCGPGETTAQLVTLGLSVRALDLSASMVELARLNNPGIDVRQGNMADLSEDGTSLDGVIAYYSTIHVSDDLLPTVFAEFARVLRPGGALMLAFQVGSEPKVYTDVFDEQLDLTFLRRRPEPVWELLSGAGFTEFSTTVRQPVDAEPTPHAYLLATKGAEPLP